MANTAPRYQWDGPHEWLADRAQQWDATKLYHELCELSLRVDFDTLQDLYQCDMEDDGYFDDLDAEGEDEDDEEEEEEG